MINVRKIIFTAVLSFAFTCTMFGQKAQAGDINANEQSIISAASGLFEYNGKTYAAKAEYIQQLAAALSKDGVDLTQQQASEKIKSIYANVGQGVSKGYLQEVETAYNSETDTESNGEPESGGSLSETASETGGGSESGTDSNNENNSGAFSEDTESKDVQGENDNVTGDSGESSGSNETGEIEKDSYTESEEKQSGEEESKDDLSGIPRVKSMSSMWIAGMVFIFAAVAAAILMHISRKKD